MEGQSNSKDEVVKTQLKEVESLIEDGDKKIRQMMYSISNALVYFLDRDGKFLFANKEVERAMGLSLDELRDKSYTELVGASSEVADGLAVDIAKVLDTDEPIVLANDVFVGCGGYKRDVVTQKAPTHYMNQKTVMIISQIKAYRADDSATPKVQLPPASPEEEVQPASTKAAAEDELLSAPPTKKAKVDDDAEAEAEAEAELPEGDISSAPADEV